MCEELLRKWSLMMMMIWCSELGNVHVGKCIEVEVRRTWLLSDGVSKIRRIYIGPSKGVFFDFVH